MPLVHVRLARRDAPTTADPKAALIAGITVLMQSVLDKRHESVVVIIGEVAPENWGEAGEPVTRIRASVFQQPLNHADVCARLRQMGGERNGARCGLQYLCQCRPGVGNFNTLMPTTSCEIGPTSELSSARR